MKVLIVSRRKNDESWGISENIKQALEDKGNTAHLISREDDLGLNSLSSSMGSLKEAIRKKDEKENYDIIYTQDWSIAFPLLIPERVFEEKHFCFFHNIQEEGKSKIFQKIVGNMLNRKLLVRTDELKKKFPESVLSSDGLSDEVFN